MLASSFFDPVLGLDVHFELVPTPVPVPTPIPNPFVGIVRDFIGLGAGLMIGAAVSAVLGAPILGPVVYWTAIPATNTGTEAKHVTGHILIPPGTAWAPFPKAPKPVIHPGEIPAPALPVKPENDAVIITGSKTVTVMGSNAVRLGDIALSCSEPLRLPSSVVLPVPKGAPILIGGPPSLDLMAAFLGSLRTRFMSDVLHALVSRMKPSRFRNLLHRGVCFFTGHPVDVASGKVMTEFVDVELPGPLPLKIERVYSSAFAARPSLVGHGWSLSVDQALWHERGKVVLLAEDGREIEFDTFDLPGRRLAVGQRVYQPIDRLTLHCDDEGAFRVVDSQGVTRCFAPVRGRNDGRAVLQRIRSRCGYHEINFHYGADGRLLQIRDSGGRTLRLRHDAHGRLSELDLPRPEGEGHYCHRRYRYDQGDLVEVVDSLGHAWRFAYVTHLLTQETDRNGLSFYFAYDGLGEDAWCVRTWGDEGIYDHVLGYDKAKRVTFVTNSLGYTTQYHMNLAGQVVKVVDPLGGTTQYEYDPVTLGETTIIDPLGRTTRYEYDDRGNLRLRTLPDGSTLELAHDAHGQVIHAITSTGHETWWKRDHHGRTIERRVTSEPTVRHHYTGAFLTSITRSDGPKMNLGYDAQGMLAEVRTKEGWCFRWAHDSLGRCIEEEGNRGATRYWFDASGHIIGSSDANGDTRQLARDPEGNILRSTTADRDVQFTYRGRGRMATRHEAGHTVRFMYDSEERLVMYRNELGDAHAFELDPRGEVVLESGLGDRRRRYRRDALGRVVEVLRPGGHTTRLEYDAGDRISRAEHSDGTTERYEYRSDGRLMVASNDVTTVRFERDAAGRVLREQQGAHWVRSSIEGNGNRVKLETSMGAVQRFEYDPLGHVVGLSNDPATVGDPTPSWSAIIVRDLAGEEIERVLPGGLRSCWQRDVLGRPIHLQVWRHDAIIRDIRLQWGANDRLQSLADGRQGRQSRYGHDRRGTLIWADYGDGTHALRISDAVGNSFQRQDLGDRTYGPAGELLSMQTDEGECLRIYCPEGNLVETREPSGAAWRYRWTGGGQLAEVERPDGRIVRFEYDALGRRVSKDYAGKKTRWLWDGHVPIHEWVEGDRAPGLEDVTTWLFEPGHQTPIAQFVGIEQYSIIHDHLGVAVEMHDREGNEVWKAEIAISGELRDIEVARGFDHTSFPFRWPGQYEDAETGLYYNRFRYYDRSAGAYISPDPLRLASRNRTAYAYVDDPLIELDPLGLNKAFWQLFDSAGDTMGSGTTVPDAGAKSIPGRVGDSEQKILRQVEGEFGDGLTGSRLVVVSQPTFINQKGKVIPIQGIAPCDFCDPAMDEFAKKHNMTIEYKYRDKTVTYPKESSTCP